MRDNRAGEAIGEAIMALKVTHPNLSAAQRADMLDEVYRIYNISINNNGPVK